MATIGMALVCLVIGVIYRRIILAGLFWLTMAIGVAFAYRVATLIDARLADPANIYYPIVGAFVGFIIFGFLGAARVRYLLIWFYLQRTIQRDREAAQAGKLW